MTLKEKALKFDITLTDEMVKQLDRYTELLLFYNKQFNLTAITEPEEIEDKHFLDSLLGARFIKKGARLCDVGSGAGFPALPLLIYRSDIELTMIDSLQKRVNFLQEVCQELGLKANCLHSRAEDAAKDAMRESFDVVTARAVAKLNTLCEYTLPLVTRNGLFVAYKSAVDDEIKQSEHAVAKLGGKLRGVNEFILPGGERRSIVIIDKISPCPKQYPRSGNKPRTSPL